MSMRCKHGLTLLITAIAFTQAHSTLSKETGLVANEEMIEINAVGQIEPYAGEHVKALLELGKLPAKRRVKVIAEIRNPYDRKFEFDQIRPSCKCIHAGAKASTIEPQGSISVELILDTPSKVVGIRQTIPVVFSKHDEPGNSLHAILRFDLEGVLSFTQEMVVAKGSPDSKFLVWRIPFLMNHPFELKNVESRGTGAFANRLVTILKEDQGAYFVQCELPTEGLTVGGVAGEIEIRDGTLDRSDRILCVAQLEPELETAPSTIHLKYDADKDQFTGSYLLKFRKGVLGASETRLAGGAHVSVNCRFANQIEAPDVSISSNAKRIAENAYRVVLTAIPVSKSDSLRSDVMYELSIKTSSGTQNWESTAKVVFSRL